MLILAVWTSRKLGLTMPGRSASRLPAPAPITCRVMGRFMVVVVAGRPVRLPGLAGRLIAYLAIRGSTPAEELVDVFWAEDDPEQSRARLRKLVWRVRRQCSDLIDRSGETLSLQRGIEVDADVFAAAADDALLLAETGAPATDAARNALACYGGELLPALRYEDWTDDARQAHRRRYVALLDLLVGDAAGCRHPDRALRYLDRAIAAEPYDESRYLWGAEILLAAGRRGAALVLLERARRMMEDLGLPPSPAATEVVERVRTG